jgi:hypothetical protein
MPGGRDGNLRGGHLAEGLGCELLRRLCAVAPVPNTEDVGIDAVCTILRGARRELRATNTFGVQIKAASARRVPYNNPRAAHWLHDLDIPFFFMSVDLKRATAALYSFEGVFMSRLDNVTFFLDWPKRRRLRSDRLLDRGPTSDRHHFWFGAPIITFSFENLEDVEFCEEVRELLECWCKQVASVLHSRRLGAYEMLHWQTGRPPTRGPAAMSAGADRAELVRLFESAAPVLSKMRIILDALGEPDLEQCLHRLAQGAVSLGASDIGALLLMPQDISIPTRGY